MQCLLLFPKCTVRQVISNTVTQHAAETGRVFHRRLQSLEAREFTRAPFCAVYLYETSLISDENRKFRSRRLYVFGSRERHSELTEEM